MITPELFTAMIEERRKAADQARAADNDSVREYWAGRYDGLGAALDLYHGRTAGVQTFESGEMRFA